MSEFKVDKASFKHLREVDDVRISFKMSGKHGRKIYDVLKEMDRYNSLEESIEIILNSYYENNSLDYLIQRLTRALEEKDKIACIFYLKNFNFRIHFNSIDLDLAFVDLLSKIHNSFQDNILEKVLLKYQEDMMLGISIKTEHLLFKVMSNIDALRASIKKQQNGI